MTVEVCIGRGEPDGGHCCWVDGQVCPFYEQGTIPGRLHVCGLRRELGSWAAVHADTRYSAHVRPAWRKVGTADCGVWQPAPGECCRKERSSMDDQFGYLDGRNSTADVTPGG